MSEKLRVFVASSSEQIEEADRVAKALNRSPALKAQPWKEKVFEFSKSYIESLEAELDRADFAVLVLTADDTANVRNKTENLPRDNVIFELGLFAGRLGRVRCFFFVDGDTQTKIASDLSGVKAVSFYREGSAGDPRRPDLNAQVEAVREQMLALGVRYKPSRAVREGQEALWRFSSRFAGHWWERMREGEDDMSALSYLTVTIDEVTNTPYIEGKAYGKAGESRADWKSISTDVQLSDKPKVFYRWEGEHEDAHGQTYGGSGVIILDDGPLVSGEGYFYDTNFAHIAEGALTRVKHCGLYRCDAADIKIMKQPWTAEAAALIKKRLTSLRGR